MKNVILEKIRKDSSEEMPRMEEIVARMAFALLAGILRQWVYKRRLKERERKKAERKIIKLKKKGKEIPEDLTEEAKKGLGRRGRKKFERRLEEVSVEKRKFINKKLLAVVLFALAVGVVVRLRKK